MKLITYGMLDDGYSMAAIASVIRTSPQTVCNWKNKRDQEEEAVRRQNAKAKGKLKEKEMKE